MEKSIIITIMVDDVELQYLDELLIVLENTFSDYDAKRINITIQDEKMVYQRPR